MQAFTQGDYLPWVNLKQQHSDVNYSIERKAINTIMNYQDIISFEKLYESYQKCKHGVIWKDSVAHFDINAMSEVNKLHNELVSGTYHPREITRFTITSPKRREIVSISFRDRVYQRSLNDNALYPIMTKSFIYDNCACQIGKGTDFARNRIKQHMSKFYRDNHSDGYVLKIDIHKYYQSINHDIVEQMLVDRIKDSDVANATLDVLRSQYKESRGYNPGSQMVQIVGISFLDGLDHFAKERLHLKHYVRYMDDIIIIHKSKEYLLQCLDRIVEYLSLIELEINKDKTFICKLSNGFEFMGFRYRLTNSGKILMLIKSDCVKRERKHLKGLMRRVQAGKMTKAEVDQCYKDWINHVEKGNSHNVVIRMNQFYEELWRQTDESNIKT